MTGVEMENAAAGSNCDDVDPLPSSPLPSSSRRKQVSKPIYSSSPGTEKMMTAGEAAGGLGWNGHESDGRWTTDVGALPEGEGVGWQSGSWVGQKPPPSDPSLPRPLGPYSSLPGWWKQAWSCSASSLPCLLGLPLCSRALVCPPWLAWDVWPA